ncbi:unnamed protein product [Macrosiphum euphorbiae]|uniref:MD-2-related lipid-recognition domain-containing protein n=1 Tax=Macrosiphum euphorbiae TaxID=13131 RepID=A0AAV0XW57_9HEMI|nr:unnamed protein product [Macrosiphum euphorbiae]
MAILLRLIVVLLMLANAVNSEEVIDYRMCPDTACLVYDLYVHPCPEALHNQPCEWKENSNTSIAFKYNPDFGANIPLTQLTSVTIFMDLPFLDIDMNACLYTHCPIKKDTEQYWFYNLFVPKNYGKTFYTVKVEFWDSVSYQTCCFFFALKIV